MMMMQRRETATLKRQQLAEDPPEKLALIPSLTMSDLVTPDPTP